MMMPLMLAFTMLVVNNWRIGITCQGSALLDHHHNHHHHHHHSAWEGSMGRSRQTLPVLTSDKQEEKSVWWSIYPRSCTWVTSPQELHNWLADDLRWWLSDALRPEPININNNIVFNKNFPQSFLRGAQILLRREASRDGGTAGDWVDPDWDFDFDPDQVFPLLHFFC